MHDDPQVAHREHFVALTHPFLGDGLYERNGFRLSDAPSGYSRQRSDARPGPGLGARRPPRPLSRATRRAHRRRRLHWRCRRADPHDLTPRQIPGLSSGPDGPHLLGRRRGLPRRGPGLAHRAAHRRVRGRAGVAAARATSTSSSRSATPGSARSAPPAGPASRSPSEYGGREATLLQQVIFYEEYARAGGPGRVGIVGEGPDRPDDPPLRDRRAAGPLPPADRERRGALVPGLLRAQRRLRSRQRADARRARSRAPTATSG